MIVNETHEHTSIQSSDFVCRAVTAETRKNGVLWNLETITVPCSRCTCSFIDNTGCRKHRVDADADADAERRT